MKCLTIVLCGSYFITTVLSGPRYENLRDKQLLWMTLQHPSQKSSDTIRLRRQDNYFTQFSKDAMKPQNNESSDEQQRPTSVDDRPYDDTKQSHYDYRQPSYNDHYDRRTSYDRHPPPPPPSYNRGPPDHSPYDRGPPHFDRGPPHYYDRGPPPPHHDRGPPFHDRGPPPHDRRPPHYGPGPHNDDRQTRQSTQFDYYEGRRPPPPSHYDDRPPHHGGRPPPPPYDDRPPHHGGRPPPPPYDDRPPHHGGRPPPPPYDDRPPHHGGRPPPPPYDDRPPHHGGRPPPPHHGGRPPPPHHGGRPPPPPYDDRPPHHGGRPPPPPDDDRPPHQIRPNDRGSPDPERRPPPRDESSYDTNGPPMREQNSERPPGLSNAPYARYENELTQSPENNAINRRQSNNAGLRLSFRDSNKQNAQYLIDPRWALDEDVSPIQRPETTPRPISSLFQVVPVTPES